MYTSGYSRHIQSTGYDLNKHTEKDGIEKSLAF